MKQNPKRIILLFLALITLFVCISLTSMKILAKKMLSEENSFRQELILRAKNDNFLAKLFNGVLKRSLHNFGLVNRDIQRSGQPKAIALRLHYWLFPFKSVVNLAWEDGSYSDEIKFCQNRDIDYYKFSWSAGGPKDWSEVDDVIKIIDNCKKPVWIHCRGGKDRTGGLVALWKKKKGYPKGLIFKDFEIYKIPAFTWIQKLLEEDITHSRPASQIAPSFLFLSRSCLTINNGHSNLFSE